MAGNYKVKTFNGVTLPTYDPSYDLPTDRVSVEPMAVTYGVYDPLGSQRARGMGGTVIVQATATGASASALQTTLDSLRALRGVRGSLVIEMADSTERSRTARCEEVRTERRFVGGDHMHLYQPVRFIFRLYGQGWNGTANTDTTVIDASPKNATVNNGGNADQSDVTITVTAGSADITALRIQNTTAGYLCDLVYDSTIAAGESLVIDCGALTVKNNGSGDYANLSLGSTHAVDDWMRLAPGNNSMTYTLTGGSTDSEVEFSHYDMWG
jgi:hypothetical protein